MQMLNLSSAKTAGILTYKLLLSMGNTMAYYIEALCYNQNKK